MSELHWERKVEEMNSWSILNKEKSTRSNRQFWQFCVFKAVMVTWADALLSFPATEVAGFHCLCISFSL